MASRTDHDLAVALPALPAAPVVPVWARWRPRLPVSAHAAVAASGVLLAWTVEATATTPGDEWPLALAVAWGAGLAAHAGLAWSGRQLAREPSRQMRRDTPGREVRGCPASLPRCQPGDGSR